MNTPNARIMFAVLVGWACFPGCSVDSEARQSGGHDFDTTSERLNRAPAGSGSGENGTVQSFLGGHATELVLKPEVQLDRGIVKLSTTVTRSDGTLRLIFRLDRNEDLRALFASWSQPASVHVAWNDDFAYLNGADREQAISAIAVDSVLRNPGIRSICGLQKVVGQVTVTAFGRDYRGNMTVGFAYPMSTGEPVESEAADLACEDWSFLTWDSCTDEACKFILPADPRLEATCTLGGAMTGATATGTIFGGAGGGQLGVLVTTRAECWNEFTGKCKLRSAWLSDYCVCSSPNAPKLVCNARPNLCDGSNGGSCAGPTASCGGSAGTVQPADAGH